VILKGVTQAAKGRRRGGDDDDDDDEFDIVLALSGIDIRRASRPVRHMAWGRITEWEIVSRRGGERLILRGGGDVTPWGFRAGTWPGSIWPSRRRPNRINLRINQRMGEDGTRTTSPDQTSFQNNNTH
jgi:hypothetical protein